MARSGDTGRRRTTGIPKALRPIVGGIALVGSVRLIDAAWRRVTGRPVPTDQPPAGDPSGPADDAGLVRDRVAYSLLLSAAMRLARRLGLPEDGDAAKGSGR
jgi:hypothetical protein